MSIEYKHISASELDLKDTIIKDFNSIEAQITLHTATVGIVADFVVQFQAVYACVRCLEEYSASNHARLLLNYVEGDDPHKKNENVDLIKTDIDKTYYQGPCIDLRIGIREAILLSIPIAPLCNESCAGLCSVCGANKNTKECACVEEQPGVFTPVAIDKGSTKDKKQKTGKTCRK